MLWSSVDELQPRLSFLKNLTRNTMGAPNSERLNTVWHGDVTTGSTCVHASKNHPKKKGLKQTQLTAAQDQVFLLHPHARGTTLRHLHHTWCVCFPPQLLPVISVSRNIKHHILHQSWRVADSTHRQSPHLNLLHWCTYKHSTATLEDGGYQWPCQWQGSTFREPSAVHVVGYDHGMDWKAGGPGVVWRCRLNIWVKKMGEPKPWKAWIYLDFRGCHFKGIGVGGVHSHFQKKT